MNITSLQNRFYKTCVENKMKYSKQSNYCVSPFQGKLRISKQEIRENLSLNYKLNEKNVIDNNNLHCSLIKLY